MKCKNVVFIWIVAGIYALLFLYSCNFCYFWDVIQQVSKEAYWYYSTNFSSLLIPSVEKINVSATGYHPPLTALMTAALWKIFGCHLWVSHALTACWAMLLMYHGWKLVSVFISKQWAKWVFVLLLAESTVLTQFTIASPDFILLTAGVICLRAVLERKPIWLGAGFVFLCGTNMRGIFTGGILLTVHLYYEWAVLGEKGKTWQERIRFFLPYLPTFVLLTGYFVYYFSNNEWFFANDGGKGHYSLPESAAMIGQNIASLGLRMVENGRFAVWVLAAYGGWLLIRKKIRLSGQERVLGLVFVLLTGMYILFACVTRMPFSSRYFMLLFFVLSLLVLRLLTERWKGKKRMQVALVMMFFFTLTGHGWIYPEKIAQCWESTLLHTPYYGLREECFAYIDQQEWDYADIGGGFCLYGDRGRIELAHEGKRVESGMDRKYFLHSNISNLPDQQAERLQNPALWTPVKHFRGGVVFITVYQKKNIVEPKLD